MPRAAPAERRPWTPGPRPPRHLAWFNSLPPATAEGLWRDALGRSARSVPFILVVACLFVVGVSAPIVISQLTEGISFMGGRVVVAILAGSAIGAAVPLSAMWFLRRRAGRVLTTLEPVAAASGRAAIGTTATSA